ncbi:helix-turn-helix domain-containing protein [Paenibacillus psychroresistens]|nr:helix-turn-helix domain-containing protein [Paenibacillus psychroresistens]
MEKDLIDPETEAHFFYHKSLKSITGEHDHDFFELFLITEGNVYHIINGTRELITEGSLVFIRPDDVHYYEKHGIKDCQLLNLAFPKVTLEALYQYLGKGFYIEKLLNSKTPPYTILSRIEINQMISRFQMLATIPNELKQEKKTELRALLAEIFINYYSERHQDIQSSIPEWLENLNQDMKKTENFIAGLPRLHELSSKSPEYLCRMIKKYYEKTPTQWVNDFRLNYAVNLMTYTDDDILVVCLDSGFENLSHFYHLFKKKFHVSPSKYRKLNRKVAIPE